eukprot:805252_1
MIQPNPHTMDRSYQWIHHPLEHLVQMSNFFFFLNVPSVDNPLIRTIHWPIVSEALVKTRIKVIIDPQTTFSDFIKDISRYHGDNATDIIPFLGQMSSSTIKCVRSDVFHKKMQQFQDNPTKTKLFRGADNITTRELFESMDDFRSIVWNIDRDSSSIHLTTSQHKYSKVNIDSIPSDDVRLKAYHKYPIQLSRRLKSMSRRQKRYDEQNSRQTMDNTLQFQSKNMNRPNRTADKQWTSHYNLRSNTKSKTKGASPVPVIPSPRKPKPPTVRKSSKEQKEQETQIQEEEESELSEHTLALQKHEPSDIDDDEDTNIEVEETQIQEEEESELSEHTLALQKHEPSDIDDDEDTNIEVEETQIQEEEESELSEHTLALQKEQETQIQEEGESELSEQDTNIEEEVVDPLQRTLAEFGFVCVTNSNNNDDETVLKEITNNTNNKNNDDETVLQEMDTPIGESQNENEDEELKEMEQQSTKAVQSQPNEETMDEETDKSQPVQPNEEQPVQSQPNDETMDEESDKSPSADVP